MPTQNAIMPTELKCKMTFIGELQHSLTKLRPTDITSVIKYMNN